MIEFWSFYNPKYMVIRQKEYLSEVKSRYDFADFQAWKHGEYMISAIQKALEPKKAKYPDSPHSMTKSEEVQTYPEIQARKFEDWANVFNKKFENQQNSKAPE